MRTEIFFCLRNFLCHSKLLPLFCAAQTFPRIKFLVKNFENRVGKTILKSHRQVLVLKGIVALSACSPRSPHPLPKCGDFPPTAANLSLALVLVWKDDTCVQLTDLERRMLWTLDGGMGFRLFFSARKMYIADEGGRK